MIVVSAPTAARWASVVPASADAKERGAELDGLGAEGQRGGDAAAVHDPARGDHRDADGVDDLRDQRHRAHERSFDRLEERAAVPACLISLDHDRIDARPLERDRLGDRRRGADRERVEVAERRGSRT